MLRQRTTGWVGFDIGGSTVKSAQAVRVGSEFRIRTASIVARRDRWNPELLAADKPLPSADELQAAASICEGVSGRFAAAVLPMVLCESVQVESAASQPLHADELTALVEAETHQSLADFVVASWPASLQANKLNVITVPEAWSNQVSSDVAAGRWNCRRIEALPWALARAVRMSASQSPAPVAALDWGYHRATLCLVNDGAPAFVRCLKDCGYQHGVAAVEAALGLPTADAERFLHRNSNVDSSGVAGVLADALAELFHRIEREFRRTLSYWQSQSQGLKPEAVCLFGGGASLGGVADRLTAMVELPVHVWDLPTEIAADATRLPPAHLLGPALAASALAWEAPR
jgi:Tfp pilus assembly PilM family ATPase